MCQRSSLSCTAGIESDAIGILSGRKDACKLNAASGREGWLAKLAQFGPEFGDLDAGHMKDYAEALDIISP